MFEVLTVGSLVIIAAALFSFSAKSARAEWEQDHEPLERRSAAGLEALGRAVDRARTLRVR